MKVPLHNLSLQYLPLKEEIDQMFVDQAMTGNHLGLTEVTKFEQKFAQFTEAEDCVGVSSGTDALRMALRAFEVSEGDEVIVPAYTWVSTAEVILDVGATPVFVDVDDEFIIDVNKIEQNITAKTKCIIHVDLYGQCADIDVLKTIADKHGLWLLQDSAQSVGTRYKGKIVGSQSHLTCYSFGPVKNLSCMSKAGGVVGQKKLIDKIKLLRNHGFSKDRKQILTQGYNARMEEFSARLLYKKLDFLQTYNASKRQVAKNYTSELQNYLEVPKEKLNSYHVYYLYTIKTGQRDTLLKHLQQNDIHAGVKYQYTMNKQKPYPNVACPKSEYFVHTVLSLPCFYGITESQQQYVIDKVKGFYV